MQGIAAEAKVHVDKKGVLIFTLPNGSMVRDSGQKVFFSPIAANVATLYAQKK